MDFKLMHEAVELGRSLAQGGVFVAADETQANAVIKDLRALADTLQWEVFKRNHPGYQNMVDDDFNVGNDA